MKAITHLKQIPASSTPLERCPWCWYVQHPGVNFPERVSSTICPGHQEFLLAQASARRAAMKREEKRL